MRRKISKKKLAIFLGLLLSIFVIHALYQWKILCSNSSIQKTIGKSLISDHLRILQNIIKENFFLIMLKYFKFFINFHLSINHQFQIKCVIILLMVKPMETCAVISVLLEALHHNLVRHFIWAKKQFFQQIMNINQLVFRQIFCCQNFVYLPTFLKFLSLGIR